MVSVGVRPGVPVCTSVVPGVYPGCPGYLCMGLPLPGRLYRQLCTQFRMRESGMLRPARTHIKVFSWLGLTVLTGLALVTRELFGPCASSRRLCPCVCPLVRQCPMLRALLGG